MTFAKGICADGAAAARLHEHRAVTHLLRLTARADAPPPPFERLLLTGAAGGLGRELRPRLRRLARTLRAERRRGDGRRGRRRGSRRRGAAGRRRRRSHRRRRAGDRPPRRHFDRRPVRADPRGQHRRRLEPVRGGAPARRRPRRLRELEPRHRLLSPGRGDRADAIRCGPTATTASARRSARTSRASTSIATASNRCACASARRSPSRRTAACSRPGSATMISSASSSPSLTAPRGRLQRRLRHVRQHDDLVGQHRGRAPRLSAAATAPSRFAPPPRRASRPSIRTTLPCVFQGGGFVDAGTLRLNMTGDRQ